MTEEEKEINYLKKDKKYLIYETNKLKKDIVVLQKQIEKMKNCGNCLHYEDDICYRCNNQTEWEIAKTDEEIEEDNNMRYLVRKIVYAYAECYTIDEEERLKLLEWIDNNI